MAGTALSGPTVSLKELPLPSIASLRAIAALKSTHLSIVRPARIGLGFESGGANQKSLADIEDALGGPGRLSLPYSLRLLLDVMAGIGVLHRTLSFVHGEVQPEHVVLGEDGVGRLIPVVRAHWVRGEQRSPERLYYLAPEKLLGDRVDVRADVFSVGVMLWEALVGQRLLEAFSVDDIIARLMGGGIPRAQAPEAENWTAPLALIAERAISVDPNRRFATIAEMKEQIETACSRYVASPPGMAELFRNPARRARSNARDSLAPDSQRATVPPQPTSLAATTMRAPSENTLEAAAAKLSRTSLISVDLEEELTTKPNASAKPVEKRPHVSTLLGVPPPFVDRESSPPEEVTTPFARVPVSSAVIITPLPLPPPAPLTNQPTLARAVVPMRSATPLSFPPPPPATSQQPPAPLSVPAALHVPAPVAAAPSSPPSSLVTESRRAPSLSPLVAAQPPRAAPLAEPSFELVRPRKSRAALWLVLGAAAAVGIFAARPWIAQQVAAATGARTETPVTVTVAQHAVAVPASPALPSVSAEAQPRPVGIASTPAAPANRGAAPAFRGGGEEHVVIHDTIDPSIRALTATTPAEPKPAATATPPAPEAPHPPAPPAPAKSQAVPVSDADRYGI